MSGLLTKRVALAVAAMLSMSAFASPAVDDEVIANAVIEKVGTEVQCLSLRTIRDVHYPSDEVMLFEVRGGATYLNELNGSCHNLSRERRFDSNSTNVGRLCKGQVITVTDRFGVIRGSCGLGDFQQVEVTTGQ
ncbi:MAG: hypothetical protein AAFX85_01860 [Pseudomonadota bacterium]